MTPPDPNAAVYVRLCRIMNSDWDPIGLRPLDDEDTEYLAYSSRVYAMLKEERGPAEIAAYLDEVSAERMSLEPDRGRSARAAAKIFALSEELV